MINLKDQTNQLKLLLRKNFSFTCYVMIDLQLHFFLFSPEKLQIAAVITGLFVSTLSMHVESGLSLLFCKGDEKCFTR